MIGEPTKIGTVCLSRNIRGGTIRGPIVVPSFSSVVSGNIGEIHRRVEGAIADAALVSAYDLHYGTIDANLIWRSENLIIDSGNYESRYLAGLGVQREWSPVLYEEALSTISIDRSDLPSRVFLVNYDQRGPINEQIDQAAAFFAHHPQVTSIFLCKPSSEDTPYLDLAELQRSIYRLAEFDVLGITEKELGSSLVERCRNLILLRKALDKANVSILIHIFGCLDPLGIIAYFCCGADIFDGTNWLKYAFDSQLAIYPNNYSILRKKWAQPDDVLHFVTAVANVSYLFTLRANLARLARNYDFSVLRLDSPILASLKELLIEAGLSLQG